MKPSQGCQDYSEMSSSAYNDPCKMIVRNPFPSCKEMKERRRQQDDPCSNPYNSCGQKGMDQAPPPPDPCAEELKACQERLTSLKKKIFECHGLDPANVVNGNCVERRGEKCLEALKCCRAQV